jgi:Carboxypeptidase regulatory-like domain
MRDIIVLSLLALCLAPAPLRAQAGTGVDILTGRVTDLTGKPIADAQVGVTSLRSGLTRSITTDANGRYKIYFPGMPPHYKLEVKRMGFAPAQRTVARRTKGPEEMTIDLQLGGAPLALSMVEIDGSPDAPIVRQSDRRSSSEGTVSEATVPNPVAEILALKDTLRLSAVQIVALTDVADSLQTKNSALYNKIRVLLAKSQQAGDASLMAGTIAMMLEEASSNTRSAVTDAEKLLRPEQWLILPRVIRDRHEPEAASAPRQD